MDLPPGQMSKEQRLKLQEWERRLAEAAEETEKHRRLLEAERRALEVEIVDAAAAVNTELTRLAHAKVGCGERGGGLGWGCFGGAYTRTHVWTGTQL